MLLGLSLIKLIKTHDCIVRTLTKDHHIPDLKYKLNSLGAFESNGSGCIGKRGNLKVSLGVMLLVKGLRLDCSNFCKVKL